MQIRNNINNVNQLNKKQKLETVEIFFKQGSKLVRCKCGNILDFIKGE